MTVKLALLKSGEEVISDVAEMVVEEKVVGYIFNYPYAAKLFGGLKKGLLRSSYHDQSVYWVERPPSQAMIKVIMGSASFFKIELFTYSTIDIVLLKKVPNDICCIDVVIIT